MTPHADDFEPGLPPDERAELERLAARLVADRPIPAPAFRGELRRRIAAAPPRRAAALRARAVAYLVTGTALLAVAALGVNDAGPLAPEALTAGSQLTASVASPR